MKNIYNKQQREYADMVDARNRRLFAIERTMEHLTYWAEGQLDALEDNLDSDQIIIDRMRG
jgi:hypothetical protein